MLSANRGSLCCEHLSRILSTSLSSSFLLRNSLLLPVTTVSSFAFVQLSSTSAGWSRQVREFTSAHPSGECAFFAEHATANGIEYYLEVGCSRDPREAPWREQLRGVKVTSRNAIYIPRQEIRDGRIIESGYFCDVTKIPEGLKLGSCYSSGWGKLNPYDQQN